MATRKSTRVQNTPSKNEMYLTDALEIASQTNAAGAMLLSDVHEANGVNTRVDLATATSKKDCEPAHVERCWIR